MSQPSIESFWENFRQNWQKEPLDPLLYRHVHAW